MNFGMRAQLFVAVLLGLCLALTGQLYAGSGARKQQAPVRRPQPEQRTGEQVFMTNCSRCHVPPMSLSPRITETVLMHMRVRARLSQEDETLLLKYLAP
jgi:cytochrome c5